MEWACGERLMASSQYDGTNERSKPPHTRGSPHLHDNVCCWGVAMVRLGMLCVGGRSVCARCVGDVGASVSLSYFLQLLLSLTFSLPPENTLNKAGVSTHLGFRTPDCEFTDRYVLAQADR